MLTPRQTCAGCTDDRLQVSVLHKPRQQRFAFGDFHRACPVHTALCPFHLLSSLSGVVSVSRNGGPGSKVTDPRLHSKYVAEAGFKKRPVGSEACPQPSHISPLALLVHEWLLGPQIIPTMALTPSLMKLATLPRDPLVPPMTLKCVLLKSIVY